jgi:hypothetical protein
MKKIKGIKQLQSEKERIIHHQEELEKKIKRNWQELKESLKPINVVKDTFSNVIRNKTVEKLNDESVLKSSFTYGIALLAKKIADKAGEKLGSVLGRKFV